MKAYNKPAASKLVARFDRDLRDILMNDLKALRQRHQFINTTVKNQLSVA